MLYAPLHEADPEIFALIQCEKKRQFSCLELIASENYTSVAVMEANGSILTNKYSEGLPGARYYAGNEFIDQIEIICQQRALKAFNLNSEEWGVNVQSYSGSPANWSALIAMAQVPHQRIMGLDLPSGGHLTHGFQTSKKKISSTSIFFESMPYQVDPESGLVDYDQLERNASLFHPKIIICGGSAYPREWDYARLRKIADIHGAYLMADIAHISGLIATSQALNPFPYCDVITTTTHKTLRGPRSGLIFFRKMDPTLTHKTDLEERVNFAVFPSTQGGPHNHTIAAVAVALKQVGEEEFKKYSIAVKNNSQVLASELRAKGYKICTDGTDNHLLLWDLRPQSITGSKMEKICEMVHITLNKNSVQGDKSAITPGGVRIGSPALTTRGMGIEEFKYIATLLDRVVNIALEVQFACSGKTLKEFSDLAMNHPGISILREEIESFAVRYPMPGM